MTTKPLSSIVAACILGLAVLAIVGSGRGPSPATGATGPAAPAGTRDGPKRAAEDYILPPELSDFAALSLVLGRPTDRAVTVSALAKETAEAYVEYGTVAGRYDRKTKPTPLPAGQPVETLLSDLRPDTAYYYRLRYRKPGGAAFSSRGECRFHTQRSPGSTFTFALQGDSHPERPRMNDPRLYARTLQQAATDRPDFYLCLGDDFSIETLRNYTADTVASRYALQRPFLGLVAQSASLFLVNGNHEQASAFNYNQTGLEHDAAVWAQTARNRYFPMPAPDGFYTGDKEALKGIGLLRDYYAWTWGDALFVVLDNYWHSPERVDTRLGGTKEGPKDRQWWAITLGHTQYRWFKETLETSNAKYKFVFAHHVLGTGRGGIEQADLYEWGGNNRRGASEFKARRPDWPMPIHQLMVKHGVTIFFQGHDHLYARQERDGMVYQEVALPADPNYSIYNEDRYASGVKFANSGYLRVTVSPQRVKVDYVRCYLPQDETEKRKSGDVADSYTMESQAKRD